MKRSSYPHFTHQQGKVSEALKWLEDEREARSYLHTLANKMHDELDSMKTATIRVSPPPPTYSPRFTNPPLTPRLSHYFSGLSSPLPDG